MRVKGARFVSVLVLAWVCLAAVCASAGAAPGDLDRFFGREGISRLESPAGGGFVAPSDMAAGPANSIYVLRRQVTCNRFPCTSTFLVSRYDPHGSLDASYGVRSVGEAPTGYGPSGEQGSLAVYPDGKVVVATTDRGKLVLARLSPDGAPDSGFGVGGVVTTGLGVPVARAEVAIQGDGKVVVGAESEPGYGEAAVTVARFTEQGDLDPAFHAGTPVVTNLGSGLGGLGLTTDSGVVIAGPRCCNRTDRALHVARLDANGLFDRSFGNRGHRFIDDVATEAQVRAVVTLPNGKIDLVGRSAKRGKDSALFMLRLLPSGRLDPRFGRRGIAYIKDADLQIAGAAVDGKGRLVIAGTTTGGLSRTSFTLLRRLPNGRADRSFGGGSLVRLASAEASRAIAIALQSGGRIVGLVESGDCERSCTTSSLLVRYLGGSSRAKCLGRKATIVGTRAGETIDGTARRDVIVALSGNDVVRGKGGNDLICGGRGNDKLLGGDGKDRLAGGPGRDRIFR